MLAIQERVAQQLVASPIDRLWQNMVNINSNQNTGLPSPMDLAGALPSAQSANSTSLSSLGNLGALLGPTPSSQAPTHALYQHGLCVWPQCNTPCETYSAFLHHLNQSHSPEKSSQQYRAQIELVENLEHKLIKEKQRLNAMKAHMHMKLSPDVNIQRHSVGPATSSDASPLVSPKPITTTPSSFPSTCTATTSAINSVRTETPSLSQNTSNLSGMDLNAVSIFFIYEYINFTNIVIFLILNLLLFCSFKNEMF